MKFREINKKLREAQYYTLAGKPIEKDTDIRDALNDILGVTGNNSVESMQQAVELLAKQKNKSRLTRQLLNDLEMIARKFQLPLGRFHYLTLQKAIGESQETRFAIRDRESGDTLSTHDDEQSARDELAGLGNEQSRYKIVKTAKPTRDFAINEEILDEVEMSPSAFRRFLNSPEAEGIRAGFEAELIFRDTKNGDDDEEYEPDYDTDERAYSIESVIDFFQGGDGIGRNAANRLRNSMYEDWQDWQRESFYNDYWDENVYNDWVQDNIWPDVEDGYMDRAREELGEDAEDTAVEELARDNFETDRLGDFESQGEWYQQAEEESWDDFRDSQASEEDWLAENYRWMSDVSNSYEVDWPYYRGGDGNGGSRDWDDIGNSLERATGLDVRVSSGYHGTRRGEWYVLEPDSSLDPDDSTDYGLEVVSPPMPLPEAIEQLMKVIDWANGSGDAYTNSSTGIHMGVSLPFKGGDVDPIKLILFMGDKDLLEKFGRSGNYYTKSAYERLTQKISSMRNAGPKQIEGVMELMKSNLIELADRELQRGVLGDKYMSVHPHDGYIEFRGPGGDYLSKESEIDGILENTMLRLAYAMSIAGRPDLYRKEYAKKLYKVLTKDDPNNPFMQLFANYSAGDITGEELKRQWAETVLRAKQGDEDVPIDVENPQATEPKKQINRRAELAKRVTRSTKDVGEQLWRVNLHSKYKFVTARSQAQAIQTAAMIDSDFGHEDARARLATDDEKMYYKQDQEREQQRAAQPQGEWTGQWLIKNADGRVLHRFGGIGNSQHDANRFAAGWLGRNHPELAGQEVEVVPEMR
jgi:hypothetical protein